jgi:MFS family permease
MVANGWKFVSVFFLFLFFQDVNHRLLAQITLESTGLFFSEVFGFIFQIPWHTLTYAVFLLIWGYLFDSHQRRKLFSVAGFIWGITSLLMSLAPTYGIFLVSSAACGIDDACLPGIYSLVGDYFKPINRGKIIGLLLITQPLGLLFSILVLPNLLQSFGWRNLFLFVGGIGFLFAPAAFFSIKGAIRGRKEPTLKEKKFEGYYLFDWQLANHFLFDGSMILIYLIGFFSFIPWYLLPSWSSNLLSSPAINPDVSPTLSIYILPSILVMTLGLLTSGMLGDIFFRKLKTGRTLVTLVGIILSSISLILVHHLRLYQGPVLIVSMLVLGFCFAFPWPNLFAMIMDITLPEIRGSASALFLLFQSLGGILSPMLVSILIRKIGLIGSTTWVSIGAWGISIVLLVILLFRIPDSIEKFHRHLAFRSHVETQVTTQPFNQKE